MALHGACSKKLISVVCLYVCAILVTAKSSEGLSPKDGRDEYLTWLHPGERGRGSGNGFQIFCQKNVSKSIVYIWRSVYLLFESIPQNYRLFGGDNETDVFQKYSSETMWHPISWVSWRDTCVSFPAFNQYCVGVKTQEAFSVKLDVRIVDYWRVLQTLVGIFLFVSALSLSRNVVFHYASGMSFGVFASVLVLLYVLTKFIPKKSASYFIMAFGYSIMLYFMQLFFYSLSDILTNYMEFLLAYIFFSALLSFIVCYRFGPVNNVRTLHLIQWSMQALGLLMIFFSSEYREASTVVILILLVYYFIPSTWSGRVKAIWFRYFPPKVKLLTETEYIEQGNRETRKALDELRRFCSSPECPAWKTISRINNPKRFASFVEGESHLSNDEMMLYDSMLSDDLSDDWTSSNHVTHDDDDF